jgi:hypothetical protein
VLVIFDRRAERSKKVRIERAVTRERRKVTLLRV